MTTDRIRFRPQFGFDAGRPYRVVLDPSRLPDRLGTVHHDDRMRALDATVTVEARAADARPSAAVVGVSPTGDVVPENVLRLYVHFSAPMGRGDGGEYIRLVDADGRRVEDPFLPLDVALWNEDRTRYTLLFDPGRVKRGIRPNTEIGAPLTAGRHYTLIIERGWPDARGVPLVEPFRRRFTVGPAEHRAIDPAVWRVSPPTTGTREPVVVVFPRALDHALLRRAIRVETADDTVVSGAITVDLAETRWSFRPTAPWAGGAHQLVVLPVLEDPAGNRVGRPFETASADAPGAGGPDAGARVAFVPHPRD